MPDLAFWSVAVLAVFIVGLSKSGLAASLGVVGTPLLSLVLAPREAAGLLLPLFAGHGCLRRLELPAGDETGAILPSCCLGPFSVSASAGQCRRSVSDASGAAGDRFDRHAVHPGTLPSRSGKGSRASRRRNPGACSGVPWAGFTSFIGHAGGPPYQIYTMPQRMPPAVYAAHVGLVLCHGQSDQARALLFPGSTAGEQYRHIRDARAGRHCRCVERHLPRAGASQSHCSTKSPMRSFSCWHSS